MNTRSVRFANCCRLPLGLLLCAASASAASVKSAPSADWHSVQALPAQTRVRIVSDTNIQTCFLDSVSDDRIACSSDPSHAGSHYEFSREQVKTIRLSGHFSWATALITTGVFTAAGAAIGRGLGSGISNSAKPIGLGAAGGLGVGAAVGVWGGRAAGSSNGSLVYRRP